MSNYSFKKDSLNELLKLIPNQKIFSAPNMIKCKCPFHKDSDYSFTINTSRKKANCLICGANTTIESLMPYLRDGGWRQIYESTRGSDNHNIGSCYIDRIRVGGTD